MVSVVASGSYTVTALDTEETVYDTTVAGVYVYNVALGNLFANPSTAATAVGDMLHLRALQPMQGSATVLSENYSAFYQGGLVTTGATAAFAASPPISAPYGFRGTIKHSGSATGRTFVYRIDKLS